MIDVLVDALIFAQLATFFCARRLNGTIRFLNENKILMCKSKIFSFIIRKEGKGDNLSGIHRDIPSNISLFFFIPHLDQQNQFSNFFVYFFLFFLLCIFKYSNIFLLLNSFLPSFSFFFLYNIFHQFVWRILSLRRLINWVSGVDNSGLVPLPFPCIPLIIAFIINGCVYPNIYPSVK